MKPTSKPISRHPKILVMRYRFIGDTLLCVPFLRALRNALPEAEIHFLAAPHSGELLENCPYIDKLLFFDTTRKHRYENTRLEKPKSFWQYILAFRREQYDTAFVLKRSFSSAFLAWASGIPNRIGFDTEGRGLLLTQKVPYHPTRHEALCFLDTLAAANVIQPPLASVSFQPEAWWNEKDEQKIASLLDWEQFPGNAQHVLLHLTTSNPAKAWRLEEAQKLLHWLSSKPNTFVHCLGTAADAALYTPLFAALPAAQQQKCHNHCGKTTLTESLALLKRMSLVVGVDSGTLHMAAAVGVPIVALFGPMDDRKWSPLPHTAETSHQVISRSLACRPCNLKHPCGFDWECMQQLSSETVIHACETVLKP